MSNLDGRDGREPERRANLSPESPQRVQEHDESDPNSGRPALKAPWFADAEARLSAGKAMHMLVNGLIQLVRRHGDLAGFALSTTGRI